MMILVTISAREVVIQIRATRKTMPTKQLRRIANVSSFY
jgi:hypothetical protein